MSRLVPVVLAAVLALSCLAHGVVLLRSGPNHATMPVFNLFKSIGSY